MVDEEHAVGGFALSGGQMRCPLELINADHCLRQGRLVEGRSEDLAAPAPTVHVALPAVEDVVQL